MHYFDLQDKMITWGRELFFEKRKYAMGDRIKGADLEASSC